MTNQHWFEMNDLKRRKYNTSVWVPLRIDQTERGNGELGRAGYEHEYFGASSVAIPTEKKGQATNLGWGSLGLGQDHKGYFDDEQYIPSDMYRCEERGFDGLNLVLEQHFNLSEFNEWHLHQDLVIALGLKREGDVWVRPQEGYIEAARLKRNSNGAPDLLEIRTALLKDYLCARGLTLFVTSYRTRDAVFEDASHINWTTDNEDIAEDGIRWRRFREEIHEGGQSYGSTVAVFHASRTDADRDDDIPNISGPPTDQNIRSSFSERSFTGRKLTHVSGELWKDEWVDPAARSIRVREDDVEPQVSYYTDEEGGKLLASQLADSGKWLWFKPEIIMNLFHRRGGQLGWYTRDTGEVSCSPDFGIHFGVNDLGLVNVYAKDVARLPEWQQQIWVACNVLPEGGLSDELADSQVDANPADTQAPEPFLEIGIAKMNEASEKNLGIKIFRRHEYTSEIFAKIHRFRAIDEAGLFALSKDVARVTADDMDATAMQSIAPPPKKTKWGSLKSLENLIALKVGTVHARKLTGPLVGVYELRLADAHLPSEELDSALTLGGIDKRAPLVFQGRALLESCARSFWDIEKILRSWSDLPDFVSEQDRSASVKKEEAVRGK
jgi:hypothetical protein